MKIPVDFCIMLFIANPEKYMCANFRMFFRFTSDFLGAISNCAKKMRRHLVLGFNSYVLYILCIWPVTCFATNQTQNFSASTLQRLVAGVNENVNSTKMASRENNLVVDGSYILNKNTESKFFKTFFNFILSLASYIVFAIWQ